MPCSTKINVLAFLQLKVQLATVFHFPQMRRRFYLHLNFRAFNLTQDLRHKIVSCLKLHLTKFFHDKQLQASPLTLGFSPSLFHKLPRLPVD